MKKTIIPHKCKGCNCELWYNDLTRNYYYFQNKSTYWYKCLNCCKGKK